MSIKVYVVAKIKTLVPSFRAASALTTMIKGQHYLTRKGH